MATTEAVKDLNTDAMVAVSLLDRAVMRGTHQRPALRRQFTAEPCPDVSTISVESLSDRIRSRECGAVRGAQKLYQSLDDNTINEAIEDTTVGIYVVKEHASSDEVEDIVLEGIKVLQDLDNVALAVAMLFGLMYVLNLSYPANLLYTSEVIQKIWMELDGDKLSNKALTLKNRLSQ